MISAGTLQPFQYRPNVHCRNKNANRDHPESQNGKKTQNPSGYQQQSKNQADARWDMFGDPVKERLQLRPLNGNC